ncbi:hypothetical protein NP493_269g03027 [Ridgeia piscesae]|uniref:Uncharacterized protein n=1 Tax=Ridgeia piscesae TaxID=27915 RepID=A0AAD9NXL2_RIDPI|nr:hypothetical protein NP493_269g03027 [Ridgeia piscesae]
MWDERNVDYLNQMAQKSRTGQIADIQSKDCVKSETICVMTKGTNVTFSAAFTPSAVAMGEKVLPSYGASVIEAS